MPDKTLSPIDFERAAEALRQEKDCFEQKKQQNSRWFALRLIMGYSSILILFLVFLACCFILVNHKDFDSSIILSSTIGIIADIVGLMISVWKIVINPKNIKDFEPITRFRK